jgi:hypothetical protein
VTTASMSSLEAETAERLEQLAREQGGAVSEETVQRLLAAAVRLYAAHAEQASGTPAFAPDSDITATEVAMTCTAMLEAVEVEVFELGMWQVWGTR